MTQLDKMIAEICPNGVEYKKMSDVVKFLNGRAYKQSELLDSGKYKVLRVGNLYTNNKWYYSNLELDQEKYCDYGDLIYTWAATLGPEIWTGNKVIFHYHIWKLVFDESVLNKRFLYHFLKMDVDNISKSLTNSTMPHISMTSMNKRLIPVPPMGVQHEIVRILESFTELKEELITELTKEFTARRKQYEYYRNKLLSYNIRIPQIRLDDIAVSISSGKNKERFDEGEFPVFGSTGIIAKTNTASYDHEQILVARVGANAGYVYLANGQYDVSDNTLIIDVKQKYLLKYVYYMLVNMKLNQYAKGGGQPLITASDLKKLAIPMPEYVVQKTIVKVLDNFNAVCTKLNINLPAEIEARQKQYGYYRDKLLTFKELNK